MSGCLADFFRANVKSSRNVPAVDQQSSALLTCIKNSKYRDDDLIALPKVLCTEFQFGNKTLSHGKIFSIDHKSILNIPSKFILKIVYL